MNRKAYSDHYKTMRKFYPSELNKACIICGSKVKYEYPDGGKLVRTFEGDVYQIMNLYSCLM